MTDLEIEAFFASANYKPKSPRENLEIELKNLFDDLNRSIMFAKLNLGKEELKQRSIENIKEITESSKDIIDRAIANGIVTSHYLQSHSALEIRTLYRTVNTYNSATILDFLRAHCLI